MNSILSVLILKKVLQNQNLICPLAKEGKGAKIEAIHRVIELVKQIEDGDVQRQIISGLFAFTNKVISVADAEEIRRMIGMYISFFSY